MSRVSFFVSAGSYGSISAMRRCHPSLNLIYRQDGS
jgi:hypothetical protein